VESRFEHRVHSKNPDENHSPVFKPSSGQDIRGTFRKAFAKFPEYKEDPWEAKIAAARARAAEQRAKITARWRPSTGDQDYRLCKTSKPAFAYLGSSSITFRPANFGRGL
jgi:hypothetical protein